MTNLDPINVDLKVAQEISRPADEEEGVRSLSGRDRDLFVSMLDLPGEPNEALTRAVQRAREMADV